MKFPGYRRDTFSIRTATAASFVFEQNRAEFEATIQKERKGKKLLKRF